MNWYAIYTKQKKEDFVAGSLAAAGIEVYYPKFRGKKFLQGCWRELLTPLFPCYLFARLQPERHSWMIKYTRGVRKLVGCPEPWPVPDDIIDLIKSREENGAIVIKQDFKAGDAVFISEGPLKGLQGIFEKELKGSDRAVLLLTAIEYQAKLVVEKSFLAAA